MSSIKELKLMNETERILWFSNAKSSDLTLVLKNEGIKGISKMKKLQKLEMIVGLVVENKVADEKIEKVIDDTIKLNEEINARQSYEEESIESTLCARFAAKEITWGEFKQAVINNNFSIPINVADEEDTKDLIERKIRLYSYYDHYDYNNNKYYSVVNKDFEWDNVFRNDGKYRWDDWYEKQLYERNTIDNGDLQLAFDFDMDSDYEYILLVYKNYQLLGYYINGNIDNIKRLVAYDYRLDDEDLETYTQLLELLDRQHEEYNKIIEADNMLRKKINISYYYKNFSLSIKENPKRV